MPPSDWISVLPPEITVDSVRWRIPRDWAPDGVRFDVDWILNADPEFGADGDWWTYLLARPAADRLEYRLELRGGRGLSTDPTNPHTVPNPFGDRSEIRFPGYAPPMWLATPSNGDVSEIEVDQGGLEAPIPVQLWSPTSLSPDAPAPLLVAHDGTGLAQSGSLLSWASAHGAAKPIRVALLDPAPGCRDSWYSANPDYLDHLADVMLPALRGRVNVSTVVGLGVSLGAVAMMTLQRRHPNAVDALALQSGSFFTPVLDPQESGFGYFDRICASAVEVYADPPERRVPLLLTCGAIEENLANNQLMAEKLATAGYPTTFVVVPDAHTTIGWRDAWAPHLDHLVDAVT